MVVVPLEDLETEGNFMGHCVGNYARAVKSKKTIIYSLRDNKNKPHVTIEVTKGQIVQIQGKENKDPIQKYHAMLDEWLEAKKLHNNETIKYITNPKKLEELAKSESSIVKCSVAKNPNTPIEVLELLTKDKNMYVKCSVAKNPNTPIEVLKLLAKDKNGHVRCTVAKNPNTPIEVLKLLAKDENEYVRGDVARNVNTPAEVLKLLAKDKKVWTLDVV
jgi:3-methyladenine DNA glycosylase AlkC